MKKCGIYFLLKNGVVVYIGQSTNLVDRMKYHNTQLLDYDCARFIKCDEDKLDYYEKRWIKKFRPFENKAHSKERKKYNYYQAKIRTKPTIKRCPSLNQRKMKFRKLTRKSVIGFGRYKDCTVDRLFKIGKEVDMVDMYFRLSHISFCDDVLNDLNITEEHRIQKPGIDFEKGNIFKDMVYPEDIERRMIKSKQVSVSKLKSLKHQSFSKMVLQRRNQGR